MKDIRVDRRRQEILERVAPIFLEKGYDNVSINEIVDIVGGSKTTIYSLFGGKQGLLEEIVKYITTEVTISIDTNYDGSLEEQLSTIGRSFLQMVLSERVLLLHRLMISVGRTFPAAGRTFFSSGPIVATSIIARWIERQQAAGTLVAGDPVRLAWIFHDMLIGEHQLGWLTSHPQSAAPERVEATVELAVKIFLGGCVADKAAACKPL